MLKVRDKDCDCEGWVISEDECTYTVKIIKSPLCCAYEGSHLNFYKKNIEIIGSDPFQEHRQRLINA